MKKTKENHDEYELDVIACKDIGKDEKTGKKLYQVLYGEVVMNRHFEMEVLENKTAKSFVELKAGYRYKVLAEEWKFPEAYLMKGQPKARLKIYFKIVEIVEQIKNVSEVKESKGAENEKK